MPNHETQVESAADLSELLYEFLEEYESDPSSQGDLLERYCDEHPALAAQIRSSVSELAEAGLFGDQTDAGCPDEYAGFEILRRLGSGGMGVVYEARQPGETATFALKVIRPSELLLGGRARFAREAEAVRGLDHPGIASLIRADVEGAEPFLAFELVRGESLAAMLARVAPDRIRGLRASDVMAPWRAGEELLDSADVLATDADGTWWMGVGWVMVGALRALAHAHDNGVVHRDVKPGNVLIGAGGRAVLVDFGLATLEGVSRLTRSGAQLGSLPYMAPEAVRGDRDGVDQRSDVYSAGVTLYELLTFRHPYLGADANATRARILEGHAIRPRDIAESIPAALENVCMKAMERTPARRYRSASAFADDLERALDGQSVLARAPGPIRRSSDWARRHPRSAIAVGASLALLVVGPLVFGAVAKRDARRTLEFNEQLSGVNQELTAALEASRAAEQRAQTHFRIAREAVVEIVAGTATDELSRTPLMQAVRSDLLASSRVLYKQLATERPDDLAVLRDLANLTKQHLKALHDLGKPDDFDDVMGEFVALIQRMKEAGSPAIDLHRDWSRVAYLGALQSRGEFDYEQVIEHANVAEREARSGLAIDADDLPLAQVLVDSLASAASAAAHLGNADLAGEFAEKTREEIDRQLAAEEQTEQTLRLAAGVLRELSSTSARLGRVDASVSDARRALETAERALALDTKQAPENRAAVALGRSQLGDTLRRGGRELGEAALSEAVESFDVAIAEFVRLATEYPNVERYHEKRDQAAGRLADVLRRQGDDEAAYDAFRRVIEGAEAQLERDPAVESRKRQLLIALLNGAGFAYNANGPGRGVEGSCTEALGLVKRCKAVLASVTGPENQNLMEMGFRLDYYEAMAHAGLGDADVWDAIERMEDRLPLGPHEAKMMLEAYAVALSVLDAGTLPAEHSTADEATAAIRERVATHLEVFARWPRSSFRAVARLTAFSRFNGDERIDAVVNALQSKSR